MTASGGLKGNKRKHDPEPAKGRGIPVAEIVMSDPERYGGEQALVVVWAKMVLRGDNSIIGKLRKRAGLGVNFSERKKR